MIVNHLKKLKNDLYEITIDQETFQLSEDFLVKYQLYLNKQISEDEYNLIKSLTNYSKVYHKTLNYLSYKMRTEYEVVCYLKDNGCIEPFLSEIITKLKSLSYINDENYSNLYVRQQFDVNKKGPLYIKQELLNKQVKLEIIEKSLQYITEEKIESNILGLIKYYDKLNKRKSINQLKEAILRNLLTKGYEYEVVNLYINNYSFDDNNDDDILLEKEVHKAYNKYQKKYQGYDLKRHIIKSLMSKGFIYEDIISMLKKINVEG